MTTNRLEALKSLMKTLEEAFAASEFELSGPMVLTHSMSAGRIVAAGVEMATVEDEGWHLETSFRSLEETPLVPAE